MFFRRTYSPYWFGGSAIIAGECACPPGMRFNDENIWEKTYGDKHFAPELLEKSVYGLPEINAEKIKKSDLVAVPGCYPTASILGILPVLDYVKSNSKIILDVKSGISGAGRNSVENSLENDLKNNFKALHRVKQISFWSSKISFLLCSPLFCYFARLFR